MPSNSAPKPIHPVAIDPPPIEERRQRGARFAAPGEKRDRYHLPDRLDSASPVGFRTRVSLNRAEVEVALGLLSLSRPASFVPASPAPEAELFDEVSLGVLSARQSTNYRGHRTAVLGPAGSEALRALLRQLGGLDADPLADATHTHVVFSRPYRTPFTFLLTFVGHKPLANLVTVPLRAWRKRFHHQDDIPTIGFLQQLHVGVLADAMERAALVASRGTRQANVLMRPFSGEHLSSNDAVARQVEALAGLTDAERRAGWRVAFVAQVGAVPEAERHLAPAATWRKIGANLLAFRSERIQPGVNVEPRAPEAYQARQAMDIPDALADMAGRAAFNAFSHFAVVERERARELLLIERIDVLTPGGKERLRQVRAELEEITRRLVRALPLWADLALGRALSSNASRGQKAFALAGQRIYVGGLSRPEVSAAGVDWTLAVRAFGASAARSALVAELMGVLDIPDNCDLLAGICLMAGPVNQNDIGKSFFGFPDLLSVPFPDRSPTSLLVWTLKAKTVADPIGNEEQLLNAARKGALVDLRPGPHEAVSIRTGGRWVPFRQRGAEVNAERAFADVANFARSPEGVSIAGNEGSAWRADPDFRLD